MGSLPAELASNHAWKDSSASLLQIRFLLRQDCALNGANLQTDSAINAGVEIDPEESSALGVGTLARMDAGHRTGVDAICHPLADIGDDRVSHAATDSVAGF